MFYVYNLYLQVPEPAETWPLAQLANRISSQPPLWEPTVQLQNISEKIHVKCRPVSNLHYESDGHGSCLSEA